MIRYHVHTDLNGHACGSYTDSAGLDKSVQSFLNVGVEPQDIKIDIVGSTSSTPNVGR